MVMAAENIARVRSHHWLRHLEQPAYHAYLSIRAGQMSVCGEGRAFESVREMDVPGVRSMCCHKCCLALYGRIGYFPPASGEEPV